MSLLLRGVQATTKALPVFARRTTQIQTRGLRSREANQGGFLGAFYKYVCRNNHIYVTYCLVGGIFMTYAVDNGISKVWNVQLVRAAVRSV